MLILFHRQMKEESRAVFKTVRKWYEVVSIVYLFTY